MNFLKYFNLSILLTGYLLIILNSNHSIWTLLSLEMMNLGILLVLCYSLSSMWFMFILSFQVCESVLLMCLLLIELNDWSKYSSMS